MISVPKLSLNDGRRMPQLGFGVYGISNAQAVAAIHTAFAAGYRLVDTATIYANEEGVGEAVQKGSVPREELFVTTKVWNDRHGYDATLRAFDESLKRLRLDYVDLYLIHWPLPQLGKYVETWRALIKLKKDGRARSIGVSNFNIPHLERLAAETGVVPAVNQIELHPRLQQRVLREYHARHGIITESWSPIAHGRLPEDDCLTRIAKEHGRTPVQIVLRWHLELGLVAIPKSVTPSRIRENIEIFDFRLTPDDMKQIAALDRGQRQGPDPDVFAELLPT
jgi:diketogulonate reductase-like aldo/keto reductase